MLWKVMQNRAKITNEYAKIVFKLVQNCSKDSPKIDAKSAIQKSIKNRAVERQRVAKVTSIIQRREVSGPEESLYSKKDGSFWQQDINTRQRIPTRRWAEEVFEGINKYMKEK